LYFSFCKFLVAKKQAPGAVLILNYLFYPVIFYCQRIARNDHTLFDKKAITASLQRMEEYHYITLFDAGKSPRPTGNSNIPNQDLP